jgi:hypothetical protein
MIELQAALLQGGRKYHSCNHLQKDILYDDLDAFARALNL